MARITEKILNEELEKLNKMTKRENVYSVRMSSGKCGLSVDKSKGEIYVTPLMKRSELYNVINCTISLMCHG